MTGPGTHPWSPSALGSASDRWTSWLCSSISVEWVGFRASSCFTGPLRSLQTPTTVSQVATLAPRIGTSLASWRAMNYCNPSRQTEVAFTCHGATKP